MKKNILYILAGIAVIFASCNPLKDEISKIKPAAPGTITVASTSSYSSVALANTGIAAFLNKTYSHLAEGTKANVTYNAIPGQIKPADSIVLGNPTPFLYTVTDADYQATNGNSNKNFSTAKSLEFLTKKYPAAVENQLSILTYTYFESGATTTLGVPAVDTFIFLNGVWVKGYQLTQAQYVAAGKLTVFNFGSADEANLTGIFNSLLKSDANVSGKARVGDVKYVSFNYFMSATKTAQRIKALIFDGSNWGTKAIPAAALAFLKKKGTWIPDPTVYYTLIKADFTVLDKSGTGTDAGIINAMANTSFDITGGPNNWTEDQILKALVVILNNKFKDAPVDETVLYKITYRVYSGSVSTKVKSFAKTSTGFVFVPDEN